jgi:hypothetical protein
MYKNVFSETPYSRLQVCPTCANEEDSHMACKKERPAYTRSIIRRVHERSYKYLTIVYENPSLLPTAFTLDRAVLEKWSTVPLQKLEYQIGLFH